MNRILKRTTLNYLLTSAGAHPKIVTFGFGLAVASVFAVLVGNADTASAAYRIIGKAD
jgi:hypothetical protein